MKLIGEDWHPWRYFNTAWNNFGKFEESESTALHPPPYFLHPSDFILRHYSTNRPPSPLHNAPFRLHHRCVVVASDVVRCIRHGVPSSWRAQAGEYMHEYMSTLNSAQHEISTAHLAFGHPPARPLLLFALPPPSSQHPPDTNTPHNHPASSPRGAPSPLPPFPHTSLLSLSCVSSVSSASFASSNSSRRWR